MGVPHYAELTADTSHRHRAGRSTCCGSNSLADHSPYAHLTDELLLPHELPAAIAPTSPLATAARQVMAGEAGTDEPDLYAVLPTDPLGGTPAIFMDIYEEPGKVLFRFDSVIANAGGTLQMYCEDCTKRWHVVW